MTGLAGQVLGKRDVEVSLGLRGFSIDGPQTNIVGRNMVISARSGK